jgi:TolB-like protein/DNA-binding winged helix-turn-helix (wHTH) protein/Tfp pilus assembly protein PilF
MNSRTSGAQVFRFGVFDLDINSGELRRHGLKIRLPEQSFQILKLLLSRPGEVVTREELRTVLWSAETFVDFEVGLNNAVRKLREALDDAADNPRFVETMPRRGYRFVAPVTPPGSDAAPPEHAAEQIQASAPDAPPTAQTSVTARRSPARLIGWRAAAVLLVVVIATAAIVYERGRRAARRNGPAAPIHSLVVLPFENLTGDAAEDYFADSVTDAITVHLARAAGLDVISRTSARQYKQTVKLVPQIGRELTVDAVVAGTAMRSGTGVRITVQLTHASTDRNVWAQSYEGDVSHLIALQRQIASDIAIAAGRPTPAPSGVRPVQSIDATAYDLYLKGLTAQGAQRYEGFRRAVAYFEEAVGIQPNFAEAYAALALAQLQMLFDAPISPHEAIPKAESAARKALQLDDTLGRAHRALGQILILYHWRWEEGDKTLDRAAQLHELPPTISSSLRRRGRFDEAIAMAERGRQLDPLSLQAQVAVGTAYRAAGQHERALHELRRALAMSPTRPLVHFQMGVTFVKMGRFAEAIPELEMAARSERNHILRHEAYLGYAYAAAGRAAEARAVLKELHAHAREQYVSSFGVALVHDALGEKAPALAALRRAYQDHAVEFAMIDQYPPFRTIESEPEFLTVMRQVGFTR